MGDYLTDKGVEGLQLLERHRVSDQAAVFAPAEVVEDLGLLSCLLADFLAVNLNVRDVGSIAFHGIFVFEWV